MINLDYTSRTPIYEQIVNEIEKYVALGILKENDKIMSIRELASNLGINPNTVKKAYEILENKNIIISISTKGTFIKKNANNVKEDIIKIELIKNVRIKNTHNNFIFPSQNIMKVYFRNNKIRILDLFSCKDITDIDYFEVVNGI